jgi:hypothetical protein
VAISEHRGRGRFAERPAVRREAGPAENFAKPLKFI